MIWIGEDRYEDEEWEELKEGFDWLFYLDDLVVFNLLVERLFIVVLDLDELEVGDEVVVEV